MELSNKIRRLRFENDEMTQKQLAELVGVSRQTMNAIENCNHAPKIDSAIRIADVFGVSVDQLFEFDYDGKPERHPTVTTVAPEQPAQSSQSALGENIDKTERPRQVGQVEHRSKTKDVEEKFSLADLRHVVG